MRAIQPARHMNMCEGPLFRKIVVYTIPIILTGILQLLFNAADLVVVGRFCGSVSVAAVGSTGSLINLLVNFFIGLSTGSGAVIAVALGAGDNERVHKTVHTAIPLACICGVILTVAGVFFTKPILVLMGTPEDVLELAALYVRVYFCGTVPSMLYNFGAAILRADGDTRRPLYYLTLAGVLNVVLNLLFVIVFKMDVAGVALATVLSQIVSAVLVLWALSRRLGVCRLFFKDMHIDITQLKAIMKVGLPAGIQSSTFSISNILIQSSINSFGTAAMSGSAASANISGFLYTAMNSFHQTSLNFVGQNYGAKQFSRIKRTVWICGLCVTVVGIIGGILCVVFARPLLSLYITDSAEAMQYGISRMLYTCLPYFLCGIMDMFTGAMRGIGSSTTPMFITVFATCFLRVVWIFTVFAQYRTWGVLFLSYLTSWSLAVIVDVIAFSVLFRRKKRLAENET